MRPLAQSPTQRIPAFQKLLRHWHLFWTIMLYAMLAIGIEQAFSSTALAVSEIIQILLYSAAFMLNFHWYMRIPGISWPKPLARTLLYFCLQFLLVSLLMHIDRGFALLCYSLLFHVAGSMQLKYWPIPMLAASAFIALMMGIDQLLLAGEWVEALGIILYLLIWPAIAFFTYIMISQRFEMQHLIEELHQAQLILMQHAQQAEELATLRERSRLARDMHDNIGHALVLVNVKLEAAQRLYALDAQRGALELEATRELIRTTMRDLRQSLANLRQAAELEQGVLFALKSLVESRALRSGLKIDCQLPEHLVELPVIVQESIWRIASEALTNVERHAQARHVTLRLEQQDRSLTLSLCDDGRGIERDDLLRSGHFGIIGMQELAQQAGGFLDISACEQGGTCVRCVVTLNPV